MDILLTGATGFSGHFLLNFLLFKGYAVTTISRSKLKPLSQKHTPIQADLCDMEDIPLKNFDVIIHSAATSPASGISHTQIVHDNVTGTLNLAKIAKEKKVKKFIFFSSLSVFGNIDEPIVSEQSPIINPNTYGASKLTGECILNEFTDFASFCIRLPAIVGFGAKRHWLANTISKLENNKNIGIYNPNDLFNNAVHVETLSKFIVSLIENHLPYQHDIVTIGSTEAMTTKQIIKLLIAKLNSRSSYEVRKSSKTSFIISNRYACEKYNYKPISIENCLTQYLDSIIEHRAVYELS